MLDTEDYSVDWICALSSEEAAAISLLDDKLLQSGLPTTYDHTCAFGQALDTWSSLADERGIGHMSIRMDKRESTSSTGQRVQLILMHFVQIPS